MGVVLPAAASAPTVAGERTRRDERRRKACLPRHSNKTVPVLRGESVAALTFGVSSRLTTSGCRSL
jgi:hypothetical protein